MDADYLHLHPSFATTSWLTLTVYLTFVGFGFFMCEKEILVHLEFLWDLNELLHTMLSVEPGM